MPDELRADCARCFGLCCVVPAFAASADFAISKPAGQPCPNLRGDSRCGIHHRLRADGFPGCTVYDCFGAGQRVSQGTFGGRDWRAGGPATAQMFAVFPIMRQLHELLRYLTEALALPAAAPLHDRLRAALAGTQTLTGGTPDTLLALDIAAHWRAGGTLLTEASALARAGTRQASGRRAGGRRLAAGADLVGARLRGADLRGTSLRGALLIGADLTGADLRLADLRGADLRAATLAGADLAGSLFLTQPQLTAASGDATTRIPPALDRPAHWPRPAPGTAVR